VIAIVWPASIACGAEGDNPSGGDELFEHPLMKAAITKTDSATRQEPTRNIAFLRQAIGKEPSASVAHLAPCLCVFFVRFCLVFVKLERSENQDSGSASADGSIMAILREP
jgi:hypothetical protein